MRKVWMRMGDADGYHDFDSMFSAGSELGGYLDAAGNGLTKVPPIGRHGSYGITVAPSFVGDNYISLFWGDEDAQPTKKLTQADIADFKAGIRDGAYLFLPKKSKSAKTTKPKSRKRAYNVQLSLKGIRR